MLINEDLFVNPDSCRFGANLDQETTINTCQVKSNGVHLGVTNFCFAYGVSSVVNVESLADVECEINTTSDIPIISSIATAESSNRKIDGIVSDNIVSDYSVLQDEVNADNTTRGNLNQQGCISQEKSTENNVVSVPKKFTKRNTAKTKSLTCHVLCCKISIVFAMCCVIGCCLIPIIFYYINQATNISVTDPEYSSEKNISSAKVCLL